MMLRIFKTSQPLAWILIVLILVVLRMLLFVFVYSPAEIVSSGGLFENWILQFNAFLPWVSHIISTLIVLFTGFYYNKIAQSLGFLQSINFLLLLFTGLFMSFYPQDLVLSPMVISAPILLYSYYLILEQPKGSVRYADVFNSAFFIGFAALVFLPSWIMLLILLIALGYLNQTTWRPFVISIIGFLTPWLFFDVLVFTFSSEPFLKINEWAEHFEQFQIRNFEPIYFSMAFLGVLIIHSVIYFKASSRTIIKIQKTLTLNFFYLLLAVVFTGFFTDAENYLVSMMVLPISVIFTVVHLEIKKWWVSDLAFLALLGLMYVNYFGV